MKKQIRMLSNLAAGAGVTLLIALALLPVGLSGARELDNEIIETKDRDRPVKGEGDINFPALTTTSPAVTVPTPDIDLTPEETTGQEAQTTTSQITTLPPNTTTTPPQSSWTEREISGTMYVNTDGIFSREVAMLGSGKVRQYILNEKVTVVAVTSTNYYKLEDGTFIHVDYLSDKPVDNPETEVTSATEPVPEVTVSSSGTAEPLPEETTTSEEVEPVVTDAQPMALEMFRLLNEYRAKNGLPALQWDYKAYPAAQIRAKELLTKNSHTRPNGKRYSSVYDEIGYSPGYTGENIVYYYSSAASALNSLINDASHRAIILSSRYTHIAIAYVYDAGSKWGYYWVQEFLAP